MGMVLFLMSFVFLASTNVIADSYFGLDASAVTLNNKIGERIEPGNLRLRLGESIAPYIDIEAQLGLTVDVDEQFQADWSADFAALFLKGIFPLGRFSSFYGLAGYSILSITETIGRRDFTDETLGFAYGVGFETLLSEDMDISLDYINYLHDKSVFDEVSAFTFGFKFYF